MGDYCSESLCCLISSNSFHFFPLKNVRDFLKIGFYDQRLSTLKSVFNKLSKIFPAVSLGYIGFFPPRLLQLSFVFQREQVRKRQKMCKLFGFLPIHNCILFRQTRHVTTWNVFCCFCFVFGGWQGDGVVCLIGKENSSYFN